MQRHVVRANVAKFPRVLIATSRRLGKRCDIKRSLIYNGATFSSGVISTSGSWNSTPRRCKGVGFQSHDVRIQRRDMTKRYIFNVEMLSPMSRRSRDQHLGNFYKIISKYRKNSLHSDLLLPKLHKACHAISPSPW